jgi:beta-aspartyl-peptidase (threonine type)
MRSSRTGPTASTRWPVTDARWSLIVHGGARTIEPDRHQANRDGCSAAARIGAAILRDGGSALDAAEQAVRRLEDDLTFNAGSGSVPTAAGEVEMDAAIMDGTTLDIGAVAALARVRHPVSLARLLLTEAPVLLAGAGAQEFARARGIGLYDVPGAESEEPQHDTVGCVAMDSEGRLAAATSTGGLPGQLPGRVGDSPIPGCGFYADDQAGAVAISGDGESILRVLLSTRVIDALARQAPPAAVAAGLRHLERVGGEAGIIALDKRGRFGIAHNSDHFSVALAASWLPDILSAVHQREFEGLLTDD